MADPIYPTPKTGFGLIYQYTHNDSGHIYIGRTTNMKERWNKHIQDTRRGSSFHFHNAIRLHKPENFTLTILEYDVPEIVIGDREKLWIEVMKAFGNGNYNMTKGGDGTNGYWKGRTQSAEHKANNAAAQRGRKQTPDVRSRIAKSRSSWWWIVDPQGVAQLTFNLCEYCREHNLCQSHLSNRGKTKGYTAFKLSLDDPRISQLQIRSNLS